MSATGGGAGGADRGASDVVAAALAARVPTPSPASDVVASALGSDGVVLALSPDVVAAALGSDPVAVAARAARPDVVRLLQANVAAVFGRGGPDAGLQALAEQVADDTGVGDLVELDLAAAADPVGPHAPAPLAEAGDGERLGALRTFARLLDTRPATAGPQHVAGLVGAGLSVAEVVRAAQAVGFLQAQVRVVAGLRALAAAGPAQGRGRDEHAAGAHGADQAARSPADPAAGPLTGTVEVVEPARRDQRPFTLDALDWRPWLTPIDLADASDEQRAALPGFRAQSPYFRLLAHDPAVLVTRTAVDEAIFYGRGGLPRAERELAAAVASRVNGCRFCASVHAAKAAELSGRRADVQRLLDEGVGTGLDPRWRAVVDLAAAVSVPRPVVGLAHVRAARAVGLDDAEISDVVHAAGFFAWANRLMLSLGEPV